MNSHYMKTDTNDNSSCWCLMHKISYPKVYHGSQVNGYSTGTVIGQRLNCGEQKIGAMTT